MYIYIYIYIYTHIHLKPVRVISGETSCADGEFREPGITTNVSSANQFALNNDNTNNSIDYDNVNAIMLL